jgi:hypothetical protein
MLATGEKTPTPASRAAPSSSEPSASTKNARADARAGVAGRRGGLVDERSTEASSSSSSGGKIEMGMAAAAVVAVVGEGEAEVSVLASDVLHSDLAVGCAANEDLWEVDAVGSPSVRAMT